MMEGCSELRALWEFPATWKLVRMLSGPLSFSAPSPTQLENALLNPSESLSLIANMHGRMLGLSAGASSAKKWMQWTSRFVRNRPDDFTFLAAVDSRSETVKIEGLEAGVKVELVETEVGEKEPHQEPTLRVGSQPPKLFPSDENAYFGLRASTRLLVLHTIADIVLSEHDSLLHAGSITDLDINDMRQYPISNDAMGNKYWYFGDCERIYREPGKKTFKTRRQKADDDAKAAKEAAKEAEAEAAKVAKEEKRREAERKRDEIRRKREERKRKSMEKWGPRVAATRTTRASSKVESSLLGDGVSGPSNASADSSVKRDAMEIDSPMRDEGGEPDDQADAQRPLGRRTSSATDVGRRTSGRRRRPPATESVSTLVRPAKRPRRSEKFVDPQLRACESWELISTGSDSLRELIKRFRAETGGLLSSEKTLVRVLEEDVLPEMLESEAKTRRELERQERKMRSELLVTVQKRSSRVQALEQKREEEAKRAAEEEEQERIRLQSIAEHADKVNAQVAALQKELSREIRVARRAHGRTEAIERDDQLHSSIDKKVAKQEVHFEYSRVRRSTRTHRGTEAESVPSSAQQQNFVRQGIPGHQDGENESQGAREGNGPSPEDSSLPTGRGTLHDGVATARIDQPSVAVPEMIKDDFMQASTSGVHLSNPLATAKGSTERETGLQLSTSKIDEQNAVARSEMNVGDPYTWSINPDDKEPIRVLDKFFFASKSDFVDAPLEACDSEQSHLIGFGVLLPPPASTVDARLVELEKVDDWSIEYGTEHKLWVKSRYAWYELRNPSVEYREAYLSTRRKYELCIRVAILGATYKPAELTYQSVVELLSYRYEDMLSYTATEIVGEKRFIMAQMENLGKRPLLQSGFMKELKKKIRSEDLKSSASQNKRLAVAQEQDDSMEAKQQKALACGVNAGKMDDQSGGVRSAQAKVRTKRRQTSTGRPVPRAVSSIISSVLRAATKSRAPVRKKKRKPVVEAKSVPLAAVPMSTGKVNGIHSNTPDRNHITAPSNLAKPSNSSLATAGLQSCLPGNKSVHVEVRSPVHTAVHGGICNGQGPVNTKELQSKKEFGNRDDGMNEADTPIPKLYPCFVAKRPENTSPYSQVISATRVAAAPLPATSVSKTDEENPSNEMGRGLDVASIPSDDAHRHTEGNGIVDGIINGIGNHVDRVTR